MALVHPSLNLIGKNKKKLNVKQQRALVEHESWLKKQGLHKDQISKKTKIISKPTHINNDTNGPKLSNKIVAGGFKKTIWDSQWKRTYEDDPLMAEREDDALRNADAKKHYIMQTYNKGPVMYAGDNVRMTELGKRR